MDFDTRGAFKSILKGIIEKDIRPRYSDSEYISYFIFPLGGDMDVEFNYNKTTDEGFVLLNFTNTTFNFCIEVGEFKNIDAPFASSDMITQKEVYDFIMHYKNSGLTDSADELKILNEMYHHAANFLTSTTRSVLYEDNPELMQEDRETVKRYKSYINQRRKELGEFELTRSAVRDMGKTTENTDGEND